jgi:hypothetical protein
MTLPTSGILTLPEILDEFGATPREVLSSMNRGGEFVPDAPANENIGEEPPIDMADFYGAEGNPSVYEHDSFILPSGGIIVLGAKPKVGLFVESHDPFSNDVQDDERFVLDLRTRCGEGQTDGDGFSIRVPPDSIYTPTYTRMKLFIGLTAANPAVSSDAALISGIVSGRYVQFYNAPDGGDTYDGTFGLSFTGPGNSISNIGTYAMRTIDDEYLTDLIPTEIDYANFRIRRGIQTDPSGFSTFALDHFSHFYRDAGFTDNWRTTLDQCNQANTTPWNAGGWLVLYNQPYTGGECDLDVDFLKLATGTITPPW